MDKTIYIIRHGETDYNRLRMVQGSGVDAELNELGRRQAQAFFTTYGHLEFEAVLTSTLQRTHQTVAPFINKPLPWQQYAELNEISWGYLEGKPYDADGKKEFRRVTNAWRKGDFDAAMLEGESARQLQERMERFVATLQHRPEKHLLICSHGRAMRGLLCVLLGKSLRRMDDFEHANTGLWRLHYHAGAYELDLRNDISHLNLLSNANVAHTDK